MFQVILAAYFLTMCELMPDSGERLSILVPVSLRRRIPNHTPALIANHLAFEFVVLQRRADNTLESVLADIQQHFLSRRSASFGEGLTPLWFDTLPLAVRWLQHLFPESWKRRRFQQRYDRDLATRSRGMIIATTIGDLLPRKLKFGSAQATYAFGSGHVSLSHRMYLLGMSGFAGSLTLNLGFAPREEVETLRDVLLKWLQPALPDLTTSAVS